MTKLKTVLAELKQKHPIQLEDFEKVHNAFMRDRKKHQKEFNQKGKEIIKIFRHYENILCGKQERSSMAKYSSSLSDKYWSEIKKDFPLIDFVGAKIS